MEGYVTKTDVDSAAVSALTKKKYARLVGDKIVLFLSEISEEPIEEIRITTGSDVHVEKRTDKEGIFTIESAPQMWRFVITDEAEMQKWLNGIGACIKEICPRISSTRAWLNRRPANAKWYQRAKLYWVELYGRVLSAYNKPGCPRPVDTLTIDAETSVMILTRKPTSSWISISTSVRAWEIECNSEEQLMQWLTAFYLEIEACKAGMGGHGASRESIVAGSSVGAGGARGQAGDDGDDPFSYPGDDGTGDPGDPNMPVATLPRANHRQHDSGVAASAASAAHTPTTPTTTTAQHNTSVSPAKGYVVDEDSAESVHADQDHDNDHDVPDNVQQQQQPRDTPVQSSSERVMEKTREPTPHGADDEPVVPPPVDQTPAAPTPTVNATDNTNGSNKEKAEEDKEDKEEAIAEDAPGLPGVEEVPVAGDDDKDTGDNNNNNNSSNNNNNSNNKKKKGKNKKKKKR